MLATTLRGAARACQFAGLAGPVCVGIFDRIVGGRNNYVIKSRSPTHRWEMIDRTRAMTVDPEQLEELQDLLASLEGCLGKMQELNIRHPMFLEVFSQCCEATDRLDEFMIHYSGEDRAGQC